MNLEPLPHRNDEDFHFRFIASTRDMLDDMLEKPPGMEAVSRLGVGQFPPKYQSGEGSGHHIAEAAAPGHTFQRKGT